MHAFWQKRYCSGYFRSFYSYYRLNRLQSNAIGLLLNTRYWNLLSITTCAILEFFFLNTIPLLRYIYNEVVHRIKGETHAQHACCYVTTRKLWRWKLPLITHCTLPKAAAKQCVANCPTKNTPKVYISKTWYRLFSVTSTLFRQPVGPFCNLIRFWGFSVRAGPYCLPKGYSDLRPW